MGTLNTGTAISTVYRSKYRLATLDASLRKALIAEKICTVDRTDVKYINSPYGNQPTASIKTINGSYTVCDFTTTEDVLTVTDEFTYAEHIYDYEQTLTQFDMFAARTDEMVAAIAAGLDKWVLNELCEAVGNTEYTTPVGGFTTPANVSKIFADCIGKVAGYADMYRGLFMVIENTDLTGVIQAAGSQGFSFADAALRNGYVNSYMGVDIYVVRTGTFCDAAATSVSGSKTWTNSGHRVFGVKGVSTYAAPRGVQSIEKDVTAKTGKEIAVWGYCGFKLWTTKAPLIVDITLA